jgi:hypothetical protein
LPRSPCDALDLRRTTAITHGQAGWHKLGCANSQVENIAKYQMVMLAGRNCQSFFWQVARPWCT